MRTGKYLVLLHVPGDTDKHLSFALYRHYPQAVADSYPRTLFSNFPAAKKTSRSRTLRFESPRRSLAFFRTGFVA